MTHLRFAVLIATTLASFPSLANAQVRPQGVDRDVLRKGRARIDVGLDIDGPDRHQDLGDFGVSIRVLGGPASDFIPGDLAAFPPPISAVVTVPDSARILIRSTADGRTWVTSSTRSPLAVGPLTRRHILSVLGFVVPQLPSGEYVAWYEPGLTADNAEHLR